MDRRLREGGEQHGNEGHHWNLSEKLILLAFWMPVLGCIQTDLCKSFDFFIIFLIEPFLEESVQPTQVGRRTVSPTTPK